MLTPRIFEADEARHGRRVDARVIISRSFTYGAGYFLASY